jgi:hypothetical protein
MLGLGGDLGSQQASAHSNAMQNLINAYGEGAGYMARRGQSIAGGLQGLGGSLGDWRNKPSAFTSTPVSRGGSANTFGVNNYYNSYSPAASSTPNTNYRLTSFGEGGR